MKINKGVIAAAGRGTRFLPTTKAYPKELIPILDKPNIQYLVEEMIGAGITEIAIIHRPGENKIKDYFTKDKELEAYLKENDKLDFLTSLKEIWDQVNNFEFIPQTDDLPYGNASPVLAAKEFIDNQPFVFMFGDDLLLEDKPGNYLSELIKVYEKHKPAVVLGCQEVPWEEINRYGSVMFAEDEKVPNQAVKVLEKLPKDKAPSNVAQFGRFVFSTKVLAVLKDQELADGELWLADANNNLAQNDLAIAQPIKQGKWLTTGDPLRWLKANLEFAIKHPDYQKEITAFLAQTDRD
jgi:UTP--glucose-1-phosphate uridylyltransferase